MSPSPGPLSGPSSVIAVVELAHIRGKDADQVTALFSRPGSAVVVSHHWRFAKGGIPAPTVSDLLGRVQAVVTDALVLWCGVQESLPDV